MKYNIGDKVFYKNYHNFIGTITNIEEKIVKIKKKIWFFHRFINSKDITYTVNWGGSGEGYYHEEYLEFCEKKDETNKYKFLFNEA